MFTFIEEEKNDMTQERQESIFHSRKTQMPCIWYIGYSSTPVYFEQTAMS